MPYSDFNFYQLSDKFIVNMNNMYRNPAKVNVLLSLEFLDICYS